MIQRRDCQNMHLCVLGKNNKHFSSLRHKYILNYLFFCPGHIQSYFFNPSVGSCVLSRKNKHFNSLQDQYILKHLFFLPRTHAVIFFQSLRWIMLYYRCVGSVFFSEFLRTFAPLKPLTSSVASTCRKSYSYIGKIYIVLLFINQGAE